MLLMLSAVAMWLKSNKMEHIIIHIVIPIVIITIGIILATSCSNSSY